MMRRGLTGCALALALLAGCSKQNDGPPADATEFENVAEPAPPPEEAPPPRDVSPPPSEPEPAPEPDRNVAEALPPEAALSVDEQMREDADAAGLTARAATPDVVTDPSADPLGAPSNGLDSRR